MTGREIVNFDVSSVDPGCVELLGVTSEEFRPTDLERIVGLVGPDDIDLAERMLQGLAVIFAERQARSEVASVSTPIEAAEGAALFGVQMRYRSEKEQIKFWDPWSKAFARIAERSRHAA